MTQTDGRLIARTGGPLKGSIDAPGDKSISHRALIFAALAQGESRIHKLLDGDDVLRTAAALRALGAEIEREGDVWRVTGGPWRTPERPLYLGNAGTGVRLLMGAVAGAGVGAVFEGDASLRRRPMGRVLEPLRLLGVEAVSNEGRLPVEIIQTDGLQGASCKLAQASAQVKSAILLAALGAKGKTRVHEPILCRDHTERMLAAFGAQLVMDDDGAAGRFISIEGGQTLKPVDFSIPGDPSSAAFPIVAAAVLPGSDITVRNVLMNPTRIGIYETLREMGADIVTQNERDEAGEPVADIHVRGGRLHSVSTPAARAPSMIDEFPALAMAAALAEGETLMSGLEELRHKESDRLDAIVEGLTVCGVSCEAGPDWLRVRGGAGQAPGGGTVRTFHDHRIAMSFLVLGLTAKAPIAIDDASMIATSFPNFMSLMTSLGARIETP